MPRLIRRRLPMRGLCSSILIALSLAGCAIYDSSVTVGDVTREQRTVLAAKSRGSVHSLSVRITGAIEGKATIALMRNGEPYDTQAIEGRVRYRWSGDWYADTAEVLYRPENVAGGTLILEYSFSTTS